MNNNSDKISRKESLFGIAMKWLCLVIIIFSCWRGNCDTVDYILKIIEDNIKVAESWRFPKDNIGIYGNVTEEESEYFGEFDFIIIGAGSSGSVIASRLSEVIEWKILLLEAGGDEDDFTDIPDMMFWSLFSERNWGYYSTPQQTCCQGMIEKRCFYPRGRILGGTSTVNGMMYARGNRKDFDYWQQLGNAGWSYKDVLPYFMKSENFSSLPVNEYHGTSGPMNVQFARPESTFYKIFAEAHAELGIPQTDYNGANQFGFSRVQFNQINGKRVSSSRAFLKNLKRRSNLKIQTQSLATKLSISTTNLEVNGVEFLHKGKKKLARATKEVILSAGTLNSPQILLLSGIGPKEDLEELNIKPRKDLPVGKHLKDHVSFFGLNFRSNLSESLYSKEEIVRQFLRGEGDLTIPANDRALGFRSVKKTSLVPDIEYILVPPSTNPFGNPGNKVFNAADDLSNYLDNLNHSTDFTMFLVHLHPKSSGNLTLKSKNPTDFPQINLNYFSDKESNDLEVMYRGIEFILQLVNTTAFQKISAQLVTGLKGCETTEKLSKEYWFCVLKFSASSTYHPVSTNKMGVSEVESVVDFQLKVHGVKKLRIADCSVFPSTISGHPHAAAVMIGEKLSHMIKKEYGYLN